MSDIFKPAQSSAVTAVLKDSVVYRLFGEITTARFLVFLAIALIVLVREYPKLLKQIFYKPPKDYLKRYMAHIVKFEELAKKNDTSSKDKTVMINFGHKSGSVRRQFILNTVSPSAINYSNYLSLTKFKNNDKIALSKEDRDYYFEMIKNIQQVDCENKYIIGIFHPYCNAGGGGEKVLWKLVADLQAQLPLSVKIAIYTGDLDIAPADIINKVNLKFGYNINISNITFIYLTKRKYVDGKYWKHFTLIAQALSSIMLGLEAVRKLPPDCFIDTMGYPFVYPVIKHFLGIPVVSYTHYPIIQQDMLNTVQKSFVKKVYWRALMTWYKFVGHSVDISITNSTWTNNHMNEIWSSKTNTIIYPPCFDASQISVDNKISTLEAYKSFKKFQCVLVAQFRPEKRHRLAISEFSQYLKSDNTEKGGNPLKLIFIGSTRTSEDDDYVVSLKKYAFEELNIPHDLLEFQCNLSFADLQKNLQESMFGLNCMWNEHFGISVVEYMASGCFPIVHASAGPLLDIVVNNYSNGVFFTDKSDPDYAKSDYLSLNKAFEYVSQTEKLKEFHGIALKNIEIVKNKFSDEKFDQDFNTKVLSEMKRLVTRSKTARLEDDEETV